MNAHCRRVVVEAPAKVNLSLDITGARPDGYHTLETVMQAIDLRDIVVVGRRPGTEIRVTCSRPGVPEDDTNIAHKAALRFFAAAGLAPRGLAIHIDKAIPVEAGLAGGSADGAAVLVGLNRLLGTGLGPEALRDMAASVGMDLPFCIAGGTALARGRGEVLAALPGLPGGAALAIAKPGRGIATKEAYRLFDLHAGTVRRPDTAAMVAAMAAGDLAAMGRCMGNVFEEVAGLEEVAALKAVIAEHGAAGAVMSGSGSAVAGLFTDRKQAAACVAALAKVAAETALALPVGHGARVIHIS